MDKIDLINLLSEELSPLGFKRKGNTWQFLQGDITKYLRIQKSQYSNLYYIYFGYILNNLKTKDDSNLYEKGVDHWIYISNEKMDLLNFENSLDKDFRCKELKKVIRDVVIENFNTIINENDVLEDIKKLPSLNLVFLNIRKYFKLK